MNRAHTRADLLVVGGGIIGLAAARNAAERGMRVVVLERGEPAKEATWAAAGMLSPFGEASGPGPFLELGLESLRMYGDWCREIEDAAGMEVEYRECGKLRVAVSQPEEARLEDRWRWAVDHGLSAERLGPGELRKLEPGLAFSLRGGLLLADDFRVDSRLLGKALVAAARTGGVEIRTGSPVRSVRIRRGRAEGVVLEDGTLLEGGWVLLAAGAWSGTLEGLPRPVPVRPVRGQMLALMPADRLSERIIESEEVYLVPRDDGRLLVGATVEEAGFVRGNTAGGVRRLLDAAHRLAPGLGAASLVEIWSGFRPGTYDGSPILGPDPEVEGLLYATGHFRNGILLAPVTARILGEMVTGERKGLVPSAFGPERWAG